jgi:hypothetical protein
MLCVETAFTYLSVLLLPQAALTELGCGWQLRARAIDIVRLPLYAGRGVVGRIPLSILYPRSLTSAKQTVGWIARGYKEHARLGKLRSFC